MYFDMLLTVEILVCPITTMQNEYGLPYFPCRSLATYDDVMTYFNRNMLKSTTTPSTRLSDIMQTSLRTCLPDESLDELQARDAFGNVSGLPVVRADGSLVGIISKGDLNKPGTHVHEVMSFPPVAARETDTVTKAACLMLKYKVHRIPVVNASRQCLGIVTRTDVFTALAVDDSSASAALNIDM